MAFSKIHEFLSRRRDAYRRTLDPSAPLAAIVLSDLAKFCRANQSTFLPDARAHAVLEGRREVWLRIQQHLQLSEEQIWKLFGAE